MSAIHHTGPCVAEILDYFGVRARWTYNARTRRNVWPAALRRAGYAVRSRRSYVRGSTVSSVKRWLERNGRPAGDPPGTHYVIRVPGHALLVNQRGRVVVDTAPTNRRDGRRVLAIMAVFPSVLKEEQ